MKITFHRESMLSACQLATGAISTRVVKLILRNAKLTVADYAATLMATDLELGIIIDLKAIKVDEGGETMLPLARFVPILRESSEEEMSLELVSGKLLIRGDHGKWELPTEDASAFPVVPSLNGDPHHEIKSGILRDLIGKTVFAAGENAGAGANMSRALGGVLTEAVDGELALVASDGRSLARLGGDAVSRQEHTTKGRQAILPVKAFALVERCLADPDEATKVCLKTNEGLMKTERATVYTRFIEGRYPDYPKWMPVNLKHSVQLTVGPLLNAIRQAAITTDEETKRLVFKFEKNKLILSASTTAGQSTIELPIEFTGKMELSFMPRAWTDMLRKLEPDSVVNFQFTDPEKPGMMTQGAYQYVVVPCFVKE